MGFCPTACSTMTLIGQPTAGCQSKTRKRTIERFMFFSCGLALPDPWTTLNLQALVDDEDVVFTPPLNNVIVNDPDMEDVPIADTIPAQKIVTKRTVSAEDRIALQITGNDFFDYGFYKNKKDHRLFLRYGIVYADGDVIIPKDPEGDLMAAWFDVFLSGQKLGNNGGTVEFKKMTLDFSGDPLAFEAPDFNYITLGVTIP